MTSLSISGEAGLSSPAQPKPQSQLPRLPFEIYEHILSRLAFPQLAHFLWLSRRVCRGFNEIATRQLRRTIKRLLERRRGAALSSLLLQLSSRGVSWFRLGKLLRESTNYDVEKQNLDTPSSSDHLITPFLVTMSSHLSSLDKPLAILAPMLDALNLPRGDLAYFIEEAPVAEDDRIPPLGTLIGRLVLMPEPAKRWLIFNGLEDEGGWWDPPARFRLLMYALGIEENVDRVAGELLLVAKYGVDVISSHSRYTSWTLPPYRNYDQLMFRSVEIYISSAFPGLDTVGEILASPKFPMSMLVPILAKLYTLLAAPDPVRSTQNRRALFRSCAMRPVSDEWGPDVSADLIYEIAGGNGQKAAEVIAGMPFDDFGGSEQPASELVPAVLGMLLGAGPAAPGELPRFVASTIVCLPWTSSVRRRSYPILDAVWSQASRRLGIGEFPHFLGSVWGHLLQRGWPLHGLAEHLERLIQGTDETALDIDKYHELADALAGLDWAFAAYDRWSVGDNEGPEYSWMASLLFGKMRTSDEDLGKAFAYFQKQVRVPVDFDGTIYDRRRGHLRELPMSEMAVAALSDPILALYLPFIALLRATIANGDLARKHLPAFTAALHKATVDIYPDLKDKLDIVEMVSIAVEPHWRAVILAPMFRLEDGLSTQFAARLIFDAFEASSEAEVRNFARMLGAKKNSTKENAVVKEFKLLKAEGKSD